MAKYQATIYPAKEERFNIISHATGLVLSSIALVFLFVKSTNLNNHIATMSVVIYGLSLIMLYAASTLYHAATKPKLRNRFNILDHAAIYVLIAGTYTPFTLISLPNSVGRPIFLIVWSIALVGVVLKLFYTGRFNTLSTIIYVAMGWIIIFAIKPLIQSLEMGGLLWLFAGGLSYSTGAFIFSREHWHYNHAIFHVFVLIGSFCHFVSVYWYVL